MIRQPKISSGVAILFELLSLQLSVVFLLIAVAGCVPGAPQSLDPTRVNDALQLIDRGVGQLREGAMEEAEASFHLAAQISPLPEALDGLGCVAFRRGDMKTAAQLFRGALELDPRYDAALAHLALVAEEEGRLTDALKLYNATLESDPRNVRARNNLAVLLAASAGDTEAARDHLIQARQLGNLPTVEHNLSRLLENER